MNKETLKGIIREIELDGTTQNMLAIGDASRAGCDECESLDEPNGEILTRTGLIGVTAIWTSSEEGVQIKTRSHG